MLKNIKIFELSLCKIYILKSDINMLLYNCNIIEKNIDILFDFFVEYMVYILKSHDNSTLFHFLLKYNPIINLTIIHNIYSSSLDIKDITSRHEIYEVIKSKIINPQLMLKEYCNTYVSHNRSLSVIKMLTDLIIENNDL